MTFYQWGNHLKLPASLLRFHLVLLLGSCFTFSSADFTLSFNHSGPSVILIVSSRRGNSRRFTCLISEVFFLLYSQHSILGLYSSHFQIFALFQSFFHFWFSLSSTYCFSLIPTWRLSESDQYLTEIKTRIYLSVGNWFLYFFISCRYFFSHLTSFYTFLFTISICSETML